MPQSRPQPVRGYQFSSADHCRIPNPESRISNQAECLEAGYFIQNRRKKMASPPFPPVKARERCSRKCAQSFQDSDAGQSAAACAQDSPTFPQRTLQPPDVFRQSGPTSNRPRIPRPRPGVPARCFRFQRSLRACSDKRFHPFVPGLQAGDKSRIVGKNPPALHIPSYARSFRLSRRHKLHSGKDRFARKAGGLQPLSARTALLRGRSAKLAPPCIK